MGLIGLIISWIIIGGIIGLLARAVMPGKQAMGLGMTIVLGVVGAIVGGFIGSLFGGDGISGIMSNPWSIGTILLARDRSTDRSRASAVGGQCPRGVRRATPPRRARGRGRSRRPPWRSG